MEKNNPQIIFEEDSMNFREVNPNWSRDELLRQDGIYYLKDVAKHLGLNTLYLKSRAKRLNNHGQSAWETMGIKSLWRCWIVRMAVFGPFLTNHFQPVKKVKPEWDGNTLLTQRGVFFLTDVCRLIPFAPNQFRHQVQKKDNARESIGVWKDQHHNAYLVDMEHFSSWLKNVWSQPHHY